jgi:hypothetical protein
MGRAALRARVAVHALSRRAAEAATVRAAADHRGQLRLDQRLIERLGGGADAVVNLGGLECLEEVEQGRLIQGRRVAFL